MDWTAAFLAVACAGAYLFGIRRGARRANAERREKLLRWGWLGAAAVVVIVVGVAAAPWSVQPWLVLVLASVAAVVMAYPAIRRRCEPATLAYPALLMLMMGLVVAGIFTAGTLGTALAIAGFVIMIVGGRILLWRRRRAHTSDS